jgi:hypothetical protein
MSVPAIFDLCEPRASVCVGSNSDSAADLLHVIRRTSGPVEYRRDHLDTVLRLIRWAIQHYAAATDGIPRLTELAC